jgi:regulator of protease activity HflC (stomatin/prohibitin superfamily)
MLLYYHEIRKEEIMETQQLITFLPIIIIVAVVALLFVGMLFVVRQQTVVVIERFGKFARTVNPGIHLKLPLGIEKIVARVNLKVTQANIEIETKTSDNVFVVTSVSTQVKVNPASVKESFYELNNPSEQIAAYVEDSLRSAIPTLTLDQFFEKKEDIAVQVQKHLAEAMEGYGYTIVKTLITGIEPAEEVKISMNEINAAQRKRAAAQELAEADRIKVVTAAKADAEKNKLHGEGIAAERKAIVDGLAQSFAELKSSGLSQQEVFSILLSNQYLDTLDQFAAKGHSTIFLPASPTGADEIRAQVLSALAADIRPKRRHVPVEPHAPTDPTNISS